MKGITYRNTRSTSYASDDMHITFPLGYAYETDSHFIHMYGSEKGHYIIQIGLTLLEAKNGTLHDWVVRNFGAIEITEMNNKVGYCVEGVWRPSLEYADIFQVLNASENEMRLSENSLRLLVQKLDEIFLYIEPSDSSLQTYSHKTRELLILACTEVENFWQYFMTLAGCKPFRRHYTTQDYVKLVGKLYLSDYTFTLKSYSSIPPIRPFEIWDAKAPTSSLPWYDAYNKTKHDRSKHFSDATLIHCINAVVANLVMHCVRFSPFPMFEQTNAFSSLVNQHFKGAFAACDTRTFYLPRINIPNGIRGDLFGADPRQHNWTEKFQIQPLLL